MTRLIEEPRFHLLQFTNDGAGYDPTSDFSLDVEPFGQYRKIRSLQVNILTSGSPTSGDGTLRFRFYLLDGRYAYGRAELMGPWDAGINGNSITWAEITGKSLGASSGFHALVTPCGDAAGYRQPSALAFKKIDVAWTNTDMTGGDAMFEEINIGINYVE